jgi:predicted transcriptional regulator
VDRISVQRGSKLLLFWLFYGNLVRVSLVFGVNKLGKHRSRLQILGTVLSVISGNEGARKTQIMYQAYLSYKLLTRYLNDVLKAGLVFCDGENCFRLTPKGERFLETFSEYHRSREVVEENLNHIEDQKLMLQEMCPNSEE